jgi:hypothetical protein
VANQHFVRRSRGRAASTGCAAYARFSTSLAAILLHCWQLSNTCSWAAFPLGECRQLVLTCVRHVFVCNGFKFNARGPGHHLTPPASLQQRPFLHSWTKLTRSKHAAAVAGQQQPCSCTALPIAATYTTQTPAGQHAPLALLIAIQFVADHALQRPRAHPRRRSAAAAAARG